MTKICKKPSIQHWRRSNASEKENIVVLQTRGMLLAKKNPMDN